MLPFISLINYLCPAHPFAKSFPILHPHQRHSTTAKLEMTQEPDVTFYFLGASRAIRVAWLLEELNLPYKMVSSPRAPNGLAPPEFKKQIGTKIGKSPTIVDRGILIQESGAITEYV
jgi:Glutathione S-transferase, N-terminal domain